MKLHPLITEKSMIDVEHGIYTFLVPMDSTKLEIKRAVALAFGVHIVSIRTVVVRGRKTRTLMGKLRVVKSRKKAYVQLAAKEKIDIFEESKKKN
jgi:ribosomal protein L23